MMFSISRMLPCERERMLREGLFLPSRMVSSMSMPPNIWSSVAFRGISTRSLSSHMHGIDRARTDFPEPRGPHISMETFSEKESAHTNALFALPFPTIAENGKVFTPFRRYSGAMRRVPPCSEWSPGTDSSSCDGA